MNIGHAIKTMREQNNLTQEELSQALGIDRTRIIRIEQQKSITTAKLEEIAQALNTKTSEIIKHAEEQN